MVIFGVIMATMLGIGWAYKVVRSNSVLPAVFLHYSIDVMLVGPLFVDMGLATDVSISMFLMSLTFIYPIVCIILAKLIYRKVDSG